MKRILLLAAVALVLVTSCADPGTSASAQPSPPTPRIPLMSVSSWQARFDEDTTDNTTDRDLSRSPDSFSFYQLSYSIDALASMYEATGQRRYADRALDDVENMIASARPSRDLGIDDPYLGWVSNQNGSTGEQVPLYESYAWRYVTRLLRVVRDGGLDRDAAVRARTDRILAFTERNIFDKWYSRGPAETIYRSRTHMSTHWASIALDLDRLTPDPARRPRYQQVVSDIDDHLPNYPGSLRAQMRPSPQEPSAWIWSDVWGDTSGVQDVSHGNAVMSYVVESRDVGGSWSAEELRRFQRTLSAFVLGRGDRYPANVDGSGKGNGWIADGFVKLGRYDPALQAALQDYGVQNSQFYASMAVNARRLGAPS